MTWRRFAVLVAGLSPHSLWHLSRAPQHSAHRNGRGARQVISDPAAIGQYLASLKTRQN